MTMERNALSTIIEEGDALDVNSHCYIGHTHPTNHHVVMNTSDDVSDSSDFDDEDDEDEQWPEAPSSDLCEQLMMELQEQHLQYEEDAACDIPLPPPASSSGRDALLYMAEKPKNAKDAPLYISDKYEALNRLRLEAGFRAMSLADASKQQAVVGGSGDNLTDVTSAQKGYSPQTSRPQVPSSLPLSLRSNYQDGDSQHQRVSLTPTNNVTPITSPPPPTSSKSRDASPKVTAASVTSFDDSQQPSCGCGHQHQPAMTSPTAKLGDQTIAQVELFYRSRKTDVYVCPSYAHLYRGIVPPHPSMLTTIHANGSGKSGSGKKSKKGAAAQELVAFPRDWTYVRTGVAVLLLETGTQGEGSSNGKRGLSNGARLSVLLAELGTGFLLWRNAFGCYTHYHAVQSNFHVMRLANDHTAFAGIAFEDPAAAGEFLQRIREFVARTGIGADTDAASASKKKSPAAIAKSPSTPTSASKRRKKPKKSDISSPCCFSHVTSLNQSEGMLLLAQSTAVTSSGVQPSTRSPASSLQRQQQQQVGLVNSPHLGHPSHHPHSQHHQQHRNLSPQQQTLLTYQYQSSPTCR